MAESNPEFVVPLIIDGKEENGSSTFNVVSPFTAVEVAKRAFPSWSRFKPLEKQKLLFKAADLLESRITKYGNIMQTEMGGLERVVHGWILPFAVEVLRDVASHIPLVTGNVTTSKGEGQSAMIWKEPFGVILGIGPFNAPFALGMRAAATAIATGNTTVLKGSELTPKCYWALGKVFHDAVWKVNFTGSTEVGSKIARTCGENLKPCLMELGGKNSAIVCADADLQEAATECIVGGFLHSVQICMSTDRIIIHADIAGRFLDILKVVFSAMAVSATFTSAPPHVVNAAARSRLQEVISKSLSEGASSLVGGTEQLQPQETDSTSPVIFTPMVIGDVRDDMQLWQEESFGPVLAYRIAKSDEEAIAMANNTEAVHINTMSVRDEPALPMGGMKKSDWGRFNTIIGMEEFLVAKTVTWDD
ncbi:hypothetical protein BCON_0059g00020 [Botryotinia convoluta]|uniref:Aldehyde dehydrogenase domain-containing protein n=1 Tax=Botryotinia convoluta TaxID=54673 RepID=A0A4Z1IMS1_9HELO|nr:hypothetical protein BCON_0059g00020 [Botryotinia convoluta]